MGVCNGVGSTCALGGYALESRCHLGNVVLYDTVTKLKWSVGVGNHGIRIVVDLLAQDFDPENGISVPIAEPQKDCVVSHQIWMLLPSVANSAFTGLFRLGVWKFQVNLDPRSSAPRKITATFRPTAKDR